MRVPTRTVANAPQETLALRASAQHGMTGSDWKYATHL